MKRGLLEWGEGYGIAGWLPYRTVSLFSQCFLTVAALLLVALPASAGLIGTLVTGYYGSIRENPTRNLFDPAQGFVPRGYLNEAGTTVTVSNFAIEFAEKTSIALITANFTDTEFDSEPSTICPPGFFGSGYIHFNRRRSVP